MARRRKSMTLAEHDALLKSDGRYDEMVDAQRVRDDQHRRNQAEWRRAQAPLVAELRKAGAPGWPGS